ncbi:response regulator transcription factor [Nocardia brasiliensis]|uniref:NobG n=2 Tax=Nocardia brasiliensis TaxID=37326 RepID=W8JD15_NOCB7|nr:response regulator transcription factor [Nocardia brasiliensis]AHK61111.1 NobG [Nocardia brasiliensis ATCC 700358]
MVAPAGIRLVVVDEHVLYRHGIVEILSHEHDMEVVGQCGERDVEATLERHRPDIAIISISQYERRPERWIRSVLLSTPSAVAVIILGDRDTPRGIGDLIAAGAGGYVWKNSTREELISAVRKIFENPEQVVLSVTRGMLQGLGSGDGAILSTREREVLTLVAAGLKNSQIADRLYLAEGTVKRHLTNIYAKLSASSRVEAIKQAIALDLLSVEAILEPDASRQR